MKNSFYKIFFTIEFDFKIVKNKRFSKYFKSDLDLDNTNFNKNINAINILAMWGKYALKTKISNLSFNNSFSDNKISNKRLITHRLVNLNTLNEVFNN